MYTKPFSLVVALLACCLTNLSAHTERPEEDESGSVRLICGVAQSRNNSYSTKAIAGAAIAYNFGSRNEHEVSLECLISAWQTTRTDQKNNFFSRISETHVPILINYRYYIRVPKTPVSFHVGGGVGCDLVHDSYSPKRESSVWDDDSSYFDDTAVSVAANASAGIVIRCSRYFGIEASYRCMWQSGSTYSHYSPDGGRNSTVYVGSRPDIVNMFIASIRFTY